ncbi:MAG TPA: VacJ family lipoprotein [Syntrophorhabdaceae bacterium]|jgi:phospholipid-binding lipoprotein MlaA
MKHACFRKTVIVTLYFFIMAGLYCAAGYQSAYSEERVVSPPIATPEEADKGAIRSSAGVLAANKAAPEAADEYGDVTGKDVGGKPAAEDEYGNVKEGKEEAEGEGARIADPIEPWNRGMYHFNDKLYFWALKPVARGYKAVLPEDIRVIINNFYFNLKAPVRIVNNLLQGKFKFAGLEVSRFLINSTVGVGGLRDCAKECFGITGREADFGQTLGKYGLGHGFYIVWPFLGPSSARDSAGFVADWYLVPVTYIIWPPSAKDDLVNPLSVIVYTHNTINYTTFHIGEYEMLKNASIDPYVSMRDIYAQYRKKKVED